MPHVHQEGKEFHYSDSAYYGRCISLSPTNERVKSGIKKITLTLGTTATIFVHTPGMFFTYPEEEMTFFGEEVREGQNIKLGNVSFEFSVD